MFAWKDSYSIGVQEIDAQHRRLFSLADELNTAMIGGKGKDVLEAVLQNLITYTKTHFAAEERLMLSCGYKELAAHKAQHDEMTKKVVQLHGEFKNGKLLLSVEVMEFLSAWLRQHIGGSDRKYVPYVMGKAVA
jgi:hemerythrin